LLIKQSRIKTHSSQILVFLVFWSCSAHDKEDSSIHEVSYATDSVRTSPNVGINLKDSSLRYDALKVDGDLNCEQHFLSALHLNKPSDVNIIHCEYLDAEHPNWIEYTYRFEVEHNDLFFYDLIEHNQMIPLVDEAELMRHQNDWFLPGSIKRYEGYYTEDDFDDFQIFKDRITGHIFIRGSQS